MARSVTYNGITQFRPGGITKINANALAQVSTATNGIIGLVGEADGGQPLTILTLDDPALAKETFRSGPLANAIRPAFEPANDPRMPGGAFRILAVKPNQSTQATLELMNLEVSDTAAAGSTSTVINLTTGGLTVDAQIANYVRINSEVRAITDNDASSVTVGTAFSSAPSAGTTVEILAPMITFSSRDYGSHTNQITLEYEPGVSVGQAWTTVFEGTSQISDDLGGKAFLQVEYIGQILKIVQESGTTDGAGTGTTLEDSAKTFSGIDDLFVEADTSGSLTTANLRKISTGSGTTITVATAFTTTPGIGTGYEVRQDVIREGTLAAGAASTATLESTIDVAANELDGLVIAITGGTGSGQIRTIASHTTGASAVLTVDEAWITTPDVTSTYQIRYISQAAATVTGAAGVATGFETYRKLNGASTSTKDLDITFTSSTTLTDLAATINADTNYQATIPDGINGAVLANTLDFDLGHRLVDLRNDKAAVSTPPNPAVSAVSTWANHFRRDLQELIDDINEKSETVSAVRSTGAGAGAGGGRPEFTALTGAGTPGSTGFKYLTGGTRGTSTNTNWQSALDLLLAVRCNFVVPLISEDLSNQSLGSTATFAAVAAQLASHVATANGVGKSERGGLLGMKGTRTQLISQANTLNNEDIQLTGQTHQVLDVDGNLETMDEWISAVIAAGMRGGAPEVGEPLTHKYLNTNGMSQDSSWDPADRTDANLLIQNGILFAETIEGKGTRWVRDLTTYVKDDNLAYMEGSTRDAVRFFAYGFRTYLEDKFTGVKATPANVASIRDASTQYALAANTDNIIMTSLNANDELVPGFEKLRITISGDIASVKIQIYPAVGINFQLGEIFLQLPRLAA